jgi:hypothetical protein
VVELLGSNRVPQGVFMLFATIAKPYALKTSIISQNLFHCSNSLNKFDKLTTRKQNTATIYVPTMSNQSFAATPGFLQDPPRLGNQYLEDTALRECLKRLVPENVLTSFEPDLINFGQRYIKITSI